MQLIRCKKVNKISTATGMYSSSETILNYECTYSNWHTNMLLALGHKVKLFHKRYKLRQAVGVEWTKAAEDSSLLGCDAVSLGISRRFEVTFCL